MELEDRAKLQEFIDKKKCLDLPPADPAIGDTIFEYTVSEDGRWVHWNTLVPKYIYPEDSIPRYHTKVPYQGNIPRYHIR